MVLSLERGDVKNSKPHRPNAFTRFVVLHCFGSFSPFGTSKILLIQDVSALRTNKKTTYYMIFVIVAVCINNQRSYESVGSAKHESVLSFWLQLSRNEFLEFSDVAF